MPASTTNVLLSQFLLPRPAVTLGRFVTNIDEPHQNFHDPDCDLTSNTVEKFQTQYTSTHRSGNHRSLGTDLTSFISTSFSKRLKTSIRITSDQVKTYYLNNNGQWFKDAVKSEETREWIEDTADEGKAIYVVVGYHTVLNARIVEQCGGGSTSDGHLVMPVSAILAATGLIVPFGELVDPGIVGSRGRMEDEQRQFVAQGEQICAVQYRKVRFKLFSSKKVDKMTLKTETQWERYDRPRDDGGEDMVEVELEDELPIEGDRESCTTASGEVTFSVATLNSI